MEHRTQDWKGRLQPLYPVAAIAGLTGLFWLLGPASGGPEPGRPAPPVAATDLEGRTATLEEYRGRVVLLDFWATWCDSCVSEVDDLKRLHARFAGKGFELLALSVDDGPAPVRAFASRHGLPYRVALVDEKSSRGYGVWALPTKYLIGADGVVVRKYLGGTDPAEILPDIEAALGKATGAS